LAEIFISYAREDSELAEEFRKQFLSCSYTVYVDKELVTGRFWETELRKEMRKAKAVVVLWSKHSVASDEVFKEATVAIEESKLFPVLVDDVPIPQEFSAVHTAELTPPRRSPILRDPRFAKILGDMFTVIGRPAKLKKDAAAFIGEGIVVAGFVCAFWAFVGFVGTNSVFIEPSLFEGLRQVIHGASASVLVTATMGLSTWPLVVAGISALIRLVMFLKDEV